MNRWYVQWTNVQAALRGSDDQREIGNAGCGVRLEGRRIVPRYSSILTTFRSKLDAGAFFWVSRFVDSNVKIAMTAFLFASAGPFRSILASRCLVAVHTESIRVAIVTVT